MGAPPDILRARVLSQFSCLGDRCSDTCCHGWSMQVDEPTLARYRKEAPELLEAVEPGGKEAPWIMRKDPGTGYCVKLEGGLCGIQKKYGDQFLSDACHFYPRVTRKLGDSIVMTASASCPEIARLAFAMENAFAFEDASAGRLPNALKNYLPEELSTEDAMRTHQAFLDAVDDASVSPEHVFARIASVSRSLELIKKKDWPNAAPFYLKHADVRLPPPETQPADPFNLLLALAGLLGASHKKTTPRLQQTISDMEKSLVATIDWQSMLIRTDDKSLAAWQALKTAWHETLAAHYDTILRRWLQMQLSLTMHPFAGLGEKLSDRVTIIGVRFATFKLALMCGCDIHGGVLPEESAVRIAQSLARFLDHLGDAAFSLQIYAETGWVSEARMRGVLES